MLAGRRSPTSLLVISDLKEEQRTTPEAHLDPPLSSCPFHLLNHIL